MEQWRQFQVMAPQLLPSRGTILSTMTSQEKCPPENQTSLYVLDIETVYECSYCLVQ